MTKLLEYWKRFVRRVKLWLFKKPIKYYSPVIKLGFYCDVKSIERHHAGNVDAYRIEPLPEYSDGWDIVITLDYLPKLQAKLLAKFSGGLVTLSGAEYAQRYGVTHRFAVYRLWQLGGTFSPIAIYDVDLYGGKQGTYAERQVRRAFRDTAYNACYVTHDPKKSPDLAWASQINRVNWLGWLEEEIRFYLSDKSHNLKAITVFEQ